jgi:K+/H+ antiporter YhaU regulatory subunit KhtT
MHIMNNMYRKEEFRIPIVFCFIELDLRKKYNVTIIAIRSQVQEREHIVPNPSPELPLQQEISLLVMGKNEILQQFKEQLK